MIFPTLDYDEVALRADALKMSHSQLDRRRIRAVMNGGAAGVQAVLGWGVDGPEGDLQDMGVDLPTANLMWSGLERLAQKIGRPPTLKTDMIPTKDTKGARTKADKRARIVQGWDDNQRLELQFPQMARWLPGYGFTFHVIKEREFGGDVYPVAELRDPFDVYPGWFGADQQPSEAAVVRRIPYSNLKAIYGTSVSALKRRASGPGGAYLLGGNWEQGNSNKANDVEVIEYIDASGTYVICTETEDFLDFIPNPLSSGPAFVLTKRFSFDKLGSQYQHVFGLMAVLGKLNLLGLIATEDSTFRETNVYGEMDSIEYQKGRDAINFFQNGTRVEKPTGDLVNQLWQGVNIVERQFRIVGGYDVQQDGQSPNSFATGAGMEQLQGAASDNIREYQTAIKHSTELIDRKRLEWEDVMHPSKKKNVYWYEGSKEFEETYVASDDIGGDYRTKRVYGAMATFDETQKILAGLQLHGAKIIDRRTLQENLDGLDNVGLINERIVQDETFSQVLGVLGMRGQNQDPAALDALWSIYKNPKDFDDEVEEALGIGEFAQQAQQNAAALAQQQGQGPGGPEGGTTNVQSILSRMEAEGGGAQTVAVNR
jgi:hypothetical protein